MNEIKGVMLIKNGLVWLLGWIYRVVRGDRDSTGMGILVTGMKKLLGLMQLRLILIILAGYCVTRFLKLWLHLRLDVTLILSLMISLIR